MKPYGFVPLNRTVKKEEIIARNRLNPDRYHGKWVIRAKALTPIIVCSGEFSIEDNQIVRKMVSLNGIPVISGSTLKGVVRSIFEAITYSCIQAPTIKDKVAKKKHRKQDILKNMPQNNQFPCTGDDRKVCPACQVFGFVNRKNVARSLVNFTDLKLQGNIKEWMTVERVPPLYSPLRTKQAIGNYLDHEGYLQRKFYKHGKPQNHRGDGYQCAKPGSEFVGEVTYFNLTKEDLGRLAFSLGIGEKPFAIKIGYGKPAFFGSVKFEIIDVVPYQSLGISSKPHTIKDIHHFVQEFGSDDRFILQQKQMIRELMDYERDYNQEWGLNAYGQKGY